MFKYNDGGRAEAGFKGSTRDCVTRAIAIATNTSYMKVYDDLNELCRKYNSRKSKYKRDSSARDGIAKNIYHRYLLSIGFKWVPKTFVGKGCTIHLKKEDLPNGIVICKLARHLTVMIDGVINDTFNPNEQTKYCYYKPEVALDKTERAVYGYYIKK